MFRILNIEILKLKRSSMMWVSIFGTLVAPILNYIMFLSIKSENATDYEIGNYFKQGHIFFAILIAPLIFGLISTYIFHREFEEKSLKNMLTVSIGRVEFIVNKMAILLCWIIFLVIFNFGTAVLLNYMGLLFKVNREVILKYLRIYVLTGLFHFMLMPSIIFVTLIFKNYIHSIGFSILTTISSMILLNTKYGELFPWSIPFLLTTTVGGKFYYPLYYMITSIILTFSISLAACILYFSNIDID